MRTTTRGLTMLETLSVIVIVSGLAALLLPALGGAMRTARIAQAKSNLHQLQLAASLYRTEHDGDGRFGTAAQMGLPDMMTLYTSGPANMFQGTQGLWASPCGQHPDTPKADQVGHNLDYHVSDDPSESWDDYSMRKQDQAIIFYDQNCNDSSVPLYVMRFKKVVHGVRLDGSLFRKERNDGDFVDLSEWDR